MVSVRTRIAPSPTGDPHVGTAYMALFNWAYARANGGEFLLRIEDTDAERSTVESEQSIYDALRWLGLDWDEGPDVGGAHAPYRQSERQDTYQEHIATLLNNDHAFHCFCSKERLDEVRQAQQKAKQTTRYDGHCIGLTEEEVHRRLTAGESHVIRMVVPEAGDCIFADRLRGEISIPYTQVDMQVLMKADGMPTYHFAVVVDDHLMAITHIIRGEEWISSVPKHKLLYGYLDWQLPELIHLPLLRNTDQSKLSKRKNPTGINYYRALGILPESLLNYLALMGYSMPDEREIFSRSEMVEVFDIDRVSVRGPVFDQEKLSWMNGQYLRALSQAEFAERVVDWLSPDRLRDLIPLVQERVQKLSDLVPIADYMLGSRAALTEQDFAIDKLERTDVVRILYHTSMRLEQVREWNRDTLMLICQAGAEQLDYKFRDFLRPLFVAISGRLVSLPLFDSLVYLGPDLSRARLREALDVLKVSGKEKKRLDKELR
ncbi:MAG: glutamate--tRNA ligase [Pseudomonadales bacterium]|nr:glutamate--tRNA ligase [Pseudomonadales bacterium]